jgi:hypothetical protein
VADSDSVTLLFWQFISLEEARGQIRRNIRQTQCDCAVFAFKQVGAPEFSLSLCPTIRWRNGHQASHSWLPAHYGLAHSAFSPPHFPVTRRIARPWNYAFAVTPRIKSQVGIAATATIGRRTMREAEPVAFRNFQPQFMRAGGHFNPLIFIEALLFNVPLHD